MQSEERMQCEIFDWIREIPELEPYAWHVPNQRKANIWEGMKLKRMGVKAGVSDIFIAKASQGYHGLFIELKDGYSKKPTEKQKKFMDDMNKEGYKAVVCYNVADTKEQIKQYLVPKLIIVD